MPDPIDISHLDQYICGDAALFDEVLTIFVEQAQNWVDQLDPSMTDDAWYHACHSLKGASRGVGAWELGNLAEQGEALTEESHHDLERIALIDKIKRQVAIACEFAVTIRETRWAS
ncbi:MAG: Hpt domain-containing protein [Pseudomonadota bacterium]